MALRARSPSRIDLAGGTLDLWPLYLLIEEAATVNLAIDLYTEVAVAPSSDGQRRGGGEARGVRTMPGAEDHSPPVYGGAMRLWWEKLRHRREPLVVDAAAFEKRFLLAYSHQPHPSGATNWGGGRRFLEGDKGTRRE